jgi:hypothetical protein
MIQEGFRILESDSNKIKVLEVNAPGLVSITSSSTSLTAAVDINFYIGNFRDQEKKVVYSDLATVSSDNETLHSDLTISSLFLFIEVDFLTSTAGEVAFSCIYKPNNAFNL